MALYGDHARGEKVEYRGLRHRCFGNAAASISARRPGQAKRRSTVLAVKVVDLLSVCGIVLGRQGSFAPPCGGGLRPALTACARCREGLP